MLYKHTQLICKIGKSWQIFCFVLSCPRVVRHDKENSAFWRDGDRLVPDGRGKISQDAILKNTVRM